METGIYARISLDRDDTQLGVRRQVDDCTAEAARRGWTVVRTYVDNDVSATSGRLRPEYEHMLADIRAGLIGGIVVWDVDRLTRTPRELEDVIDLAEQYGIKLANVGGDIDLSTPQGRMTARIKGSVARHETDQLKRRVRRKMEENAAAGRPHGLVPFGFIREDGRDLPDPETAPLIREAAKRVLAGDSIRAVAASWNDQGIPAPRGGRWTSQTIKQILKRPSNAGLRTFRGEVVGRSASEPIYDEGTHDRLLALFADPSRTTGAVGNAPKHLLSRIAVCGRCGGKMRRLAPSSAGKKQLKAAYGCSECYRIRRKQELVDAVVEGAVIARLQQPDLLAALTAGEPDVATAAREEVDTLEARLALAADQFADGDLTGEQLKRITERLRPKVAEAKRRLQAAAPRTGVTALAGADAAEKWAAASIDAKRAVIQELMTVTILPATPGAADDPELIRLDWKG